MANAPKINQPEPPKSTPEQKAPEAPVEQKAPEVVEQKVPETPVVKPVVQPVVVDESAFSARERIPSDWEINPVDDGTIWARNSATARIFEGTIAKFNKKLRG